MADRLVGLVPLRGGSKSIPKKNIKPLAGKPVCDWSLEAARAAGIFDRLLVSTDSEEIASTVRGLGLDVDVLMRPAELATDTASTESVMLHAAAQADYDVLCTIQATSPLTSKEDFRAAWEKFRAERLDSLVTGVRSKRFFWDDAGKPVNYDPLRRPRRQDFGGWIMENGAFYLTRRAILETHKCRLGGAIGVHEMPEESAVEIDEPSDWPLVESLLLRRGRNSLREAAARVKLLVVDVDGTLTDGGMFYSPDGEMLKQFNTRDAKGLELARLAGIRVAILTSENSPIVTARARKLGIEECHIGVKDKVPALEALRARLGVSLDEIAYIGDDVNDLDCLRKVGFPGCPKDAMRVVRESALYVSEFPGGHGAVRDFCETLLEARG
jgi:YrbI family 3-deoxy-D-manno-octulosonate 8-phosphate phosphatase